MYAGALDQKMHKRKHRKLIHIFSCASYSELPLKYLLDLLVKHSRNFSQLATDDASRIPHISPSDKRPFVLSPFDQGFQLEFYTPTSHRDRQKDTQTHRHGTYTVQIEKNTESNAAHSELQYVQCICKKIWSLYVQV
jgi:hypothetical protein